MAKGPTPKLTDGQKNRVRRWIVGKEDIDSMRANPRPLEYLNSEQPLVNLLQELSKRTKNRQIHVQTPGFSVTLERRA